VSSMSLNRIDRCVPKGLVSQELERICATERTMPYSIECVHDNDGAKGARAAAKIRQKRAIYILILESSRASASSFIMTVMPRVPGLLIQRLLLSLPIHNLSDVEIELDDVMESRYGTNKKVGR